MSATVAEPVGTNATALAHASRLLKTNAALAEQQAFAILNLASDFAKGADSTATPHPLSASMPVPPGRGAC
jgi:hypothetical protein